jgi:hypothetical protein
MCQRMVIRRATRCGGRAFPCFNVRWLASLQADLAKNIVQEGRADARPFLFYRRKTRLKVRF